MKRLVIDPGHGGSDPGAVGYGKQEKDVVLDIAYAMMRQAGARGMSTMLTRNGDKTVAINTRYEIANRWGADLFMSIHTNASGGRGIEVLYGKPPHLQLARDLAAELCRVTGWPMRRGDGTWYRPGVGVLRGTVMPAVLSECGFIDNPEENAAMNNPAWIKAVAQAHIDVACRYLGIKPGEKKEDDRVVDFVKQASQEVGQGVLAGKTVDVWQSYGRGSDWLHARVNRRGDARLVAFFVRNVDGAGVGPVNLTARGYAGIVGQLCKLLPGVREEDYGWVTLHVLPEDSRLFRGFLRP